MIELGARRPALFEHQRFVASECAQPVAGRRLARGEPQVAEQIADRAASRNGETGGGGSSLAKMDVRIDEAGGDGASRELDQMSSRTDQRFQLREMDRARRSQPPEIATESLPGWPRTRPSCRTRSAFPGAATTEIYAFVASERRGVLVGTWKRFGFFDLHFDVATLETGRRRPCCRAPRCRTFRTCNACRAR